MRASRVHHLPPAVPWDAAREAAARPRELLVDPPPGDDEDDEEDDEDEDPGEGHPQPGIPT